MRVVLPLLCVLVACAHGPRGASKDSLKTAAEEVHQRARWRDWRGVAVLVAADRRLKFLTAIKEEQADRDLTVTDYELLDARVDEGTGRGTVLSRVSWIRMPSPSEKNEDVTSRFVFESGNWFLESQVGGPLGSALAP